jgi:hypothetical protein
VLVWQLVCHLYRCIGLLVKCGGFKGGFVASERTRWLIL